ncbi:MAG: translocation/assembly module TamB domain-containing protein [Sphingobacterium sp.]
MTSITLLSIFLLSIGMVLALRFASVQTYVSKRVADYLSAQLDTEVTVERVYLEPFHSLELQSLLINDQRGQKLLYIKQLSASISLTKILSNRIVIKKIDVQQAYLNFEIFEDSTNVAFLIDYFTTKEKKDESYSAKLALELQQVELLNNEIHFTDHRRKPRENVVNFNELALTQISGSFRDIAYDEHHLEADIKQLTFKDKSGLYLKEFTAQSFLSSSMMEFTGLTVETNYSKVGNYLMMRYNSFSDFENFIKDVKVEGTLSNAYIDSRDIALFAPEVAQIRFTTAIQQATLLGTVEHIQANDVILRTGSSTRFKGDFTVDGLPRIENTFFDFKITSLETSAEDLEQFIPKLTNNKSFKLPLQVHQLGDLKYQGRANGLYHQFVISGTAETKLGTVETKSTIGLKPALSYAGTVKSQSFAVGTIIKAKNIDTTGFDIDFRGQGTHRQSLELWAAGELQNINFRDYTYESLIFEGKFANDVFVVNGNLDDQFAALTYDGTVDLSGATPKYLFSSNIQTLDLKKLKLFDRDPILISNSNIQGELHGSSLNSLNGTIKSSQLQFSSSRGAFKMESLIFSSEGDEQNKRLKIESDVVDGTIQGQIDLNTIVPYFRSLAMRYAPAINIESKPYNPQNFDLQLEIKSFGPISALFDPNLRLDDGAKLSANFSSDNYTATFDAFTPIVSYRGIGLKNLKLLENADDTNFSLDISADRLSFTDSTYIDNIKIANVLANDSLNFELILSEADRENYVNLNGNIHFAHNKPAYIRLKQSDIVLNQEHWNVNHEAELRVSKGKIYLNNLVFKHERQEIKMDGVLSDQDDDLNISFQDFNLTSLSGITKPIGIDLLGNLSGDVRLNSVFDSPNFSAHITTTPIVYNNIPVGNLIINADYDPTFGMIRIASELRDVDGDGINLTGTYDINNQKDALAIQAKARDVDLGIAQPFLRYLVSDLYGTLSGEVTIKGSLKNPVFNGFSHIKEGSFLVNYLQSRYEMIEQHAILENNTIYLKDYQFKDEHGAIANSNGYINLNKLSDPELNIKVSANNLQILNTKRNDNEVFYGTAFASGNFTFLGPTSALAISMNAQSEPNTTITLPFNTSLTVSDSDFLYFMNPDSAELSAKATKRLFKGLTMNMDLAFTPDAEINLENNVGSLTGVGNGNVSLRLSNLGDLEMFGDYRIVNGKFHFTAQDFFNKYFDLKEGGTVRWAGNPAEAIVNLSASYQQRTSIAPLYNAAGRTENNDRILAQADMLLKGSLSQPEVSFELNFPQDPYVKDELQGYLSDINNVNQQAISLIVRRSFTPASTQEFGREVNNTLLSAGTEIAFNQLNSIISQSLNMNFLDLNIRSFNDASASLRFFDDRLIFTGGVTDRSKTQLNDLTLFSDQIATDAELTFRLRDDGNLVLRAYNRLNTRNFLFTPYSDYISAVGLVYRQEFNSLSDFWRNIWISRRKQIEVEKDEASPNELPKATPSDTTRQELVPFP